MCPYQEAEHGKELSERTIGISMANSSRAGKDGGARAGTDIGEKYRR